jgi:uncharacterized membrane protein YhaH (DUF805 family)
MFTKALGTRILGVIAVLNFVLFFFFLTFPYYCYLGVDHYIPKSNPALGYFMPKSPEARFFLILALFFLALAFATTMLLWKRLSDEGSMWATPL